MKQRITKSILLSLIKGLFLFISYGCLSQNKIIEIFQFDKTTFPLKLGTEAATNTYVIYADEINVNEAVHLISKNNIILFANKINMNNDFQLCVSNFNGVNSDLPSREHGGSSPFESYIFDDKKCIDFKKQYPSWFSGDIVISVRQINLNKKSIFSLISGSYYFLNNVPPQLYASDYVFSNIYKSSLKSYCVVAADSINYTQEFDYNFCQYLCDMVVFDLTKGLYSRGWITTDRKTLETNPVKDNGEIFWAKHGGLDAFLLDMHRFFFTKYGINLNDSTITPDSGYSYEYYISRLKLILLNVLTSAYLKKREKYFSMFPFGEGDERGIIPNYSPILKYERQLSNSKYSAIYNPYFTNSDFSEGDYSLENVDYNCFSSTSDRLNYYYSKWVISYLKFLYSRYQEMKLSNNESGKNDIIEKIKNLKPTYRIIESLKSDYTAQIQNILAIKNEFVNSFVVKDVTISVNGNEENLKAYSYQNPGNYYLMPTSLAIEPVNVDGKDHLGTIQLSLASQSNISFNGILLPDLFKESLVQAELKKLNPAYKVVGMPKDERFEYAGIYTSNSSLPIGIIDQNVTIKIAGNQIQCQLAIEDAMSGIFWNNLSSGSLKLKFYCFLPNRTDIKQEFYVPLNISNINKYYRVTFKGNRFTNECPFDIYVDYILCDKTIKPVNKIIKQGTSLTMEGCSIAELPFESLTYIFGSADNLSKAFYQFSGEELNTNKFLVFENLIADYDQQYDKRISYAQLNINIDDQYEYTIDKLPPYGSNDNKKRINFFSLQTGKIKVTITGKIFYTDSSERKLKDKTVHVFEKSTISITSNDFE